MSTLKPGSSVETPSADSLNGREVSIARMHTTIHVLNYGNLGPVIDFNSNKGSNKIKMIKHPDGVYISGLGPNNSIIFEMLVPNGNLQSLQFVPKKGSNA